MNFRIKETGKIEELSIIDENGVNWTGELIGNSGALGSYITYDEQGDLWEISQEDFNWWAKYIENYIADETTINELFEEIAANADELSGGDYDRHHDAKVKALEEYRTELTQYREIAKELEGRIARLEDVLRQYRETESQSEPDRETAEKVSALEQQVKGLRATLVEIIRKLISLPVQLLRALKNEGKDAWDSLKVDFYRVKNGLAEAEKDVQTAQQEKERIVSQEIGRTISKGNLVAFSQRLPTAEAETYPKLFSDALARNDRIGSAMAEELIKAAAQQGGFDILDPAYALRTAMTNQDQHTVAWLRSRPELPLTLTALGAGEALYSAVKEGYPKTANILINTASPNYKPEDVTRQALYKCMENGDLKTAKTLIAIGADVKAFVLEASAPSLSPLDTAETKFLSNLLRYWNRDQVDRTRDAEEEDFER